MIGIISILPTPNRRYFQSDFRREQSIMAQQKKHKKKKQGWKIVLLSFFLVALFIACIYGAYTMMVGSSPYINASPTPGAKMVQAVTASPLPSAAPTPTSTASARPGREPEETATAKPKSSSDGSSSSGSMITYEDDSYGYSCPYPDSFSKDNVNDNRVRLSLRSLDGSAYEHILVDEAPSDNPAMDMRAFLSRYPSAIIQENRSGNDYFYALIKDGSTYIYRYMAYSDGTAKGFEFGYENADQYQDYPQEIRDNFMLY